MLHEAGHINNVQDTAGSSSAMYSYFDKNSPNNLITDSYERGQIQAVYGELRSSTKRAVLPGLCHIVGYDQATDAS